MNYLEIINFIRSKFESVNSIPLHAPCFIGNEKKYLLETIDSTFVSSVGIFVDKSEFIFEELTGTKKAVAVVNGTSGLHIALKLVGVNKGDEVLTQALSFVATSNAILYNEANPVFLDVDYDTMGLSPNAVENFLEEFAEFREGGTFNKKTNKRISACIPMHTFGFPARMDELIEVCLKWRIPIVEDSAEALGSYYKGRHAGSMGEIGVFSFNGNKIVTSGGGGMIISNNLKKGILAKHLTTTAKVPHQFEYFHDQLGFNFRLPNLNAALLCAQMEKLDFFLKSKRTLAKEYSVFFNRKGVKFREELPDTEVNYWLMCVELENKFDRDLFLEKTNKQNVLTRPIWTLLYKLPMYKHCYRDNQLNAEKLELRIVNIPSGVSNLLSK
jgi:perosamine synthetase